MRQIPFVILAAGIACHTVVAQPPVPTGKPTLSIVSPEHYFLHLSFSRDHGDKARKIASAKASSNASDKAKGDAMETARLTELGLTPVDLKKVDQTLDRLERNVKVVENKIRSHLDDAKAKKKEKDLVLLRKLESERYATIVKIMSELYLSMTPAGAQALRRHMNQVYRGRLLTPTN